MQPSLNGPKTKTVRTSQQFTKESKVKKDFTHIQDAILLAPLFSPLIGGIHFSFWNCI